MSPQERQLIAHSRESACHLAVLRDLDFPPKQSPCLRQTNRFPEHGGEHRKLRQVYEQEAGALGGAGAWSGGRVLGVGRRWWEHGPPWDLFCAGQGSCQTSHRLQAAGGPRFRRKAKPGRHGSEVECGPLNQAVTLIPGQSMCPVWGSQDKPSNRTCLSV